MYDNEHHICNQKSTLLAETSTNITGKSILPIRGISYGRLNEEKQKFSVTIGQLVCFPNMTLEKMTTIKYRVTSNEKKILENSEKIRKDQNRHEVNEGKFLLPIQQFHKIRTRLQPM